MADYSAPPDPGGLTGKSVGHVRGVIAGSAAPTSAPFTMSLANGENGPMSVTLHTLYLRLRISVSSADLQAGSVESGTEAFVLLPIWEGPAEYLDQAIKTYADPLHALVPVGAQVWTPIKFFDGAKRELVPAEIASVVLADAQGKSPLVASAPAAGTWGFNSLDEVVASAG